MSVPPIFDSRFIMIEIWFPTLIYSENLSNKFDTNFNLNLYNRLKQIKEYNPPIANWNCDTYTTIGLDSINLKYEKYFSDLLETCEYHITKFAEEFRINPKHKLCCREYWGNIAAPGDFQERHVHTNSHFSLVYYVKCQENCGDIVFYSHNSEESLSLHTTENIQSNYSFCSYKPIESTILIFRSNIPHMVKQNKSNQDRCSLAMNFSYDYLLEA